MSEFSRLRQVKSGLPEQGAPFELQADTLECAAIAARLELASLDVMRVQGRLRRGPRKPIVIVQGEIEAHVVQNCVVTFEPVAARLHIPFERYFTSEPPEFIDEIIIGVDDEEPDPFDGETLDIGEIAVEELALAIDPYPRAPGAGEVLSHLLPKLDEPDETISPFAKLQALKRRDP